MPVFINVHDHIITPSFSAWAQAFRNVSATCFFVVEDFVAINDDIKATRAKLGLPEVPPTVMANEKAMADLKTIFDAVKFDAIVKE